ncbi:MAG: ATP-binding protein [Candidatus Dormibacteraeota bacterium]|nr:ATP-binding protein [Candidatus Dormibacteraeota bacterium]
MLAPAPGAPPAPSEPSLPPWAATLIGRYQDGIAHAFILHFNIADYVEPGRSLRPYLARLFGRRTIVAFYNRAEGITFPLPSMRTKALALLGLTAPAGGAVSAMTAALNLLPGAAGGAGDPELPKGPGQALPLLERLLGSDIEGGVAVVIDYAETLAPAADLAMMGEADRTHLIILARWGRDPAIQATGNPVVLVTANLADLHPTLRAASSKFEVLEIPLPAHTARQAFITAYAATKPAAFAWALAPAVLAHATAGLSLIHIEDIFLRAEQEGTLSWRLVKERKDDIIAGEFGEVLEILDPRFGFAAIGGLEYVKEFLRRSVIRPMQEGRTRRVPQGILLLGPAGTGKSALAEALAQEAGVNFVVLNLARIFQGLVGASERNLEKALRAVESLAPVIVFVDEIDQSVQRGGSGDSGVSSRIFKRLLEFMANTGNRGRVLWLGACNRPDLLDAALRRPGRFDKKLAILVPDREERRSIFLVHAAHNDLGVAAIAEGVLDATENWTGAEIQAAVVKAVELIEDGDAAPAEALTAAVARLKPSTTDIEWMTLLALREVNDLDLLPPRYREELANRPALEQRIADLQPAPPVQRGRRVL